MPRTTQITRLGGTKAKDIEPYLREARRLGWQVVRTPGGHVRWTSPDGVCLFTALTPRSPKARKL